MRMSNCKIGIIGGSGLKNPSLFKDPVEKVVTTKFGSPSDVLLEGNIEGVPCVFLARHGRKHTIFPSAVNYRANLLALKKLGCTHIIVSTACGSLREEIEPGHFVIIDQFIDRTTKRHATFYDSSSDEFKGILHLPMDSPFCSKTRQILLKACKSLDYAVHATGTMVTIEGPRFSSKAESKMFRSWGGDVINMTTVPEVVLACELGLCYASIAMSTDYDCWKEDDTVSVEKVLQTIKLNSDNAIKVIKKAVVEIGKINWEETMSEFKTTVDSNII